MNYYEYMINTFKNIKNKTKDIINRINESVKGKNNTTINSYNPLFKPIFKNEEKLENNSLKDGLNTTDRQYFEIYKLNNINNAFYFTYQDKTKRLEILKYKFIDKSINKINSLNLNSDILKIKYFFDEFNNKEYLFILLGFRELCIDIYQIENENNYNKIKRYNLLVEEDSDLQSMRGLSICDFEILYNEYLETNYFLVSYYYYIMGIKRASIKKIKFLKFEDNECKLFNNYIFSDSTINDYKKIKITYKDKISEQYYLLVNYKNEIYKIIITNGILEERIIFDEAETNKIYGCVIYGQNYKDYLYLYDSMSILYIYDIKNKQSINKFKILENINSMLKWNDEYIIFGFKNSIYIFDTQLNKIITKYQIKDSLNENISSIKKIWIKDINFFSLFLEIDNKELRLLY